MEQNLQEQPQRQMAQANDEITLKDIILKIQEWWSILWPHRFRIIALSLSIGLIAAMYTKFITMPTYTATYQLFFQEESGGLNGAMRLASSFGLGVGGGSTSSSATVQEYLTSRSNIVHALTEEMDNGRLIDRYFEEDIEKDEEFAQEFASKFGVNQRYTDSTLTFVALAFSENVLGATLDEESGVLSFRVVTYDESFTYDLATQLINNTDNQFKYWKKEKALDAVKAFQKKVDSLEVTIDATLRRLGEYQDQNNSLISAVDKMEQMRLTLHIEALKVAYGEYIKGLEMSKVELMNIEGPFKYFDAPIFPLEKNKTSAALAAIVGFVMTVFLLVVFYIGSVEAKNILYETQ